MKEKDHTFVVAEMDNKVVGFANFYDNHEKQQIEIEGLYVSPTCAGAYPEIEGGGCRMDSARSARNFLQPRSLSSIV